MKKKLLFLAIAGVFSINSDAQNPLGAVDQTSALDAFGEIQAADRLDPSLFDNTGGLNTDVFSGYGGDSIAAQDFGDGYGGGIAQMNAAQSLRQSSPNDYRTFQLSSVRQNYPDLETYIIPSLNLDEGIELSQFLLILEEYESFKINWILDANVSELYSSKMPQLKFYDMHVGDILDALNSFALSSRNYNILFKSNKNTLSIEQIPSAESGDKRPVQSYPMAEFYKRYSMAEILTLVEAALQFEGGTPFKGSVYKPRYHEESQILMLNLTAEESGAINNLFSSLRMNSTSREYTHEYKEKMIYNLLQQKEIAKIKMSELEHQLMELIEKSEKISEEITLNPESDKTSYLNRMFDNLTLREKYMNDQIHKTMSIISKIEEEIFMIESFGKE